MLHIRPSEVFNTGHVHVLELEIEVPERVGGLESSLEIAATGTGVDCDVGLGWKELFETMLLLGLGDVVPSV